MDEFEVIRTFFASQPVRRDDVLLGIGDDAAVLSAPPGAALVCTTDLLVEDVHFPAMTAPCAIGHKALAVNLSDLAAMGARPAWATMTLALTETGPAWLQDLCRGFFGLAERFGVQLVGGDLTRGPLAIGVHLTGFADDQRFLTRHGARPGDDIYVSGCLGDAALGLRVRQGALSLAERDRDALLQRLEYPEPRVCLGRALLGLATSAIDVSDGLCADLGHVATASGVAARVDAECLPLSETYRSCLDHAGWGPALTAGDDYELCFTAAPGRQGEVEAAAAAQGVAVTRVGGIEEGDGVRVYADGEEVTPRQAGYEHFRAH